MIPLADAVAAALGIAVTALTPVSGGDINRAFHARTAEGDVFVKHHPDPPAGMFTAEAAGLAWLGAAGAIRLPAVLAVREEAPALIVLEWIAPGSAASTHDEDLGRGLAGLHRAGAPAFGRDDDNWLATLPQDNAAAPTWAEFYAERRLSPLVRRTRDAGRLPGDVAARVERVIADMPRLAGPDEPPARIHGDLWSGNAIVDAAGRPVLIDPAAYGGHREMDLAMMRLFGGFGPRVFAAYAEAAPLVDGHADRVELWQLWPLLAHVALFGGGYVAAVDRAARRYAR